MTRLYSYVVRVDTGFAPNPFAGMCTLATCKPAIRRVARPGDWIIGTGSSRSVGANRLVYAMRVAEVLPLEEYGRDPRYQRKRPGLSGPGWRRCGDNIYLRGADGQWQQRRSPFHGPAHQARDVSGRNVLIGREFYYLGSAAIPLPSKFRDLIKSGPGHKRVTDPGLIAAFEAWLRRLRRGRLGLPINAFRHLTARCSRRALFKEVDAPAAERGR